ncbi:aminotransferase class IV family protein [Sinosporangium siamense]|uniref:Aminotransferase n=1 Tax=Sinosporangium siamense TaxID=1367973 RepID=A0A919RJX7_9ACTN|nr:aminotransferase class IV family protein [Sinosporangium siamense]GII95003.1 hypothetical protein Ssi02_52340 [Sinosporangium siamense]
MSELNGVPVTLDALQSLALINYGHFTTMRVEEQRVKGLSRHLDRLARDCRTVFGVELDRDEVCGYMRHAVDGRPGPLVLRVTVFDPTLDLGRPGGAAQPQVLVTTRPAAALPAQPMTVQTMRFQRDLPAVKHVGLFSTLRIRRQAQVNGYDDALFTDNASFVTEGATWNVGFFDGDRVVWPSGDMLPGVTMGLLQHVHHQTVTRSVSLHELPAMRAAFATNTAIGIRVISKIDNIRFPVDHPIVEVLRKEYEAVPFEPLTPAHPASSHGR